MGLGERTDLSLQLSSHFLLAFRTHRVQDFGYGEVNLISHEHMDYEFTLLISYCLRNDRVFSVYCVYNSGTCEVIE